MAAPLSKGCAADGSTWHTASMREVLVTALLATACGALGFDVDQDLPEQTIQGSPLGGLLPSFLPSPFTLSIDVKSETQKRSTGPATSASLKALRFEATPHASPGGNFDFVDEIHIFIESPTIPKQEIANVISVPKGATRLDLHVVPGVDLLPYLNAGATISASATGRQPTSNFTIDGHVTVTVHI